MTELITDPILNQYAKKIEDDVTERYSSILSIHLFRFFGLVFINILGYLDRLLTFSAVSKEGITIEENVIMRALHINPWIHIGGLFFMTSIWGAVYLTSDKKDLLKLDVTLILVLSVYLLVIANNITTLIGMMG